MSEKILIALRDVAKKVGITPAQAKYWVKLLGVVLVMRGRVGFLEEVTADNIMKMADLVTNGASPKNAAFEISGVVNEKEIIPVKRIEPDDVEELKEKLDRLETKNGQIEKAILMLAEENRATRQEMTKLVEVNQALRLRLEPPPLPAFAPPRPIKVWEPVRVQPIPTPWYERLWLQMFNPEMLRVRVE